MRNIGTVAMGIRTPIIKSGDDLAGIMIDSLLKAKESIGFEFKDRDIVAVTEAVVGISEKNYASIDQISKDIKNKLKSNNIGIVFPIYSRNRFAVLLSAICRSTKKITMLMSYPKDEVGNDILFESDLVKYGINPYSDTISDAEYMEKFSYHKHLFTGVNIVNFYREVAQKENCDIEFVFNNNPKEILKYTNDILVCDIHSRENTKKALKETNANVIGLDEILKESVDGSGYNSKYGLLGSNRSTEEVVKLFPEHGQKLVEEVQRRLKELTGKTIEVLVYGDGAFRDPVGHIWELADPVVSPAYTKGLEGSPSELKLKYLSDNKFKDLKGEELIIAMKEEIRKKDANLLNNIVSQGTTPRKYTDLIGSLCDLVSGSGDKGTPVVYIQGYFDNYAD